MQETDKLSDDVAAPCVPYTEIQIWRALATWLLLSSWCGSSIGYSEHSGLPILGTSMWVAVCTED